MTKSSTHNLNAATVAIVGAGGLGTPASWHLASSWKKTSPLYLLIIDPDKIERSNLNRQILFDETLIGKSKAESLCQALSERCPEVNFTPVCKKLAEENIEEILSDVDYVIDATDSVKTKFLINDFCRKQRLPFCYGGVAGYGGQLLAVPVNPNSSDLREIFGDFTEEDYQQQTTTCQHEGILGPVAGQVGVMQAEQALEYFTADEKPEQSVFLRFSLNDTSEKKTILPNKPAPAKILNLTDKKCPMTFVYTKLALEKINLGEQIEVHFDNQDSSNNVERSCQTEGYKIISPSEQINPNTWAIKVEKSC